MQALREGQERKAFEILQQDIAQQRSGRERFRRRMQLVDICATTNKPNIAQPILDDLAAAIELHKLDEWEDPGVVAGALATIMKMSPEFRTTRLSSKSYSSASAGSIRRRRWETGSKSWPGEKPADRSHSRCLTG